MLLEVNPNNIDDRKIAEIVSVIRRGGLVVIPTDSVYAICCDLLNKKALNNMAKLKGVKLSKANFSIICKDLSSLSDYTKHVSRPVYKVLNKSLPGPFTYILNASNQIPKLFDSKKKTVGIRIPDNKIVLETIESLGNPIAVTSVHDEDEILDYTTDPNAIYERYENDVELIVDGGFGNNEASTVVDCSNDNFEIIRQGIGDLDLYL